jgi:predicted O-linked N-acetylglucosamine transferase (SPINDLY family)
MNSSFDQLMTDILLNIKNKNYVQSKQLLIRALQIAPNNFDVLNLIGYLSGLQGNFIDAKYYLYKAHELQPCDASVIFNLANACCDLGEFNTAIELLEKAENLKPNKSSNYHLRAKCHLNLGETEKSINYFQKSLYLNLNVEVLFDLCNVLIAKGHIQDAIHQYDWALNSGLDIAEIYVNKGLLHHQLKQYDLALVQFDKALKLNPNLADAWSNKGVTLSFLGDTELAILHFEKAINLNESYPEAYANLGICLNDLSQFDKAIIFFDKAIKIKPHFPVAYSNKALALSRLYRSAEAAKCFFAAYDQSEEDNFYLGQAIHQLMLCCDWKSLNNMTHKLNSALLEGKKSAEPFGYQGISKSEANNALCSKIYCDSLYPANFTEHKNHNYKHNKIRIGYVCGEFRAQATSILLTRIWELHDRHKFDIYAFDSGLSDNSNYRKRIENTFGNQIINISNKTDSEVYTLINNHEIDILVNLNGYFGNMRQAVFAMRPSPISVNFLGFPGTLGSGYMDYLIADKVVIPEDSMHFYDEKIVYLPNSYQPNDNKRVLPNKNYSRKFFNLPDDAFIFCCFNNNYKINPDIFDIWMRILKAVDKSILWLLEFNDSVSSNLKIEATRRGVNAERIVFSKKASLEEHISRHCFADLFLDTLPYNSHTTGSDALWAGLPVLTTLGSTFPGRVGASLLHAINLPELVTKSLVEYEILAIELANNPKKLYEIKEKLKNNRISAALFDSQLYTVNLESAYIEMYKNYVDNFFPKSFTVIPR